MLSENFIRGPWHTSLEVASQNFHYKGWLAASIHATGNDTVREHGSNLLPGGNECTSTKWITGIQRK